VKQKVEAILDDLIAAHHIADPSHVPLKTLLGLPAKKELSKSILNALYLHARQAFVTFILMAAAISLAWGGGHLRDTATMTLGSVAKEGWILESFQTDQPIVALTFEVGQTFEEVVYVLEVLAFHKMKATFFITEEWFDKYPKLTKEILTEGHDLGNMGKDLTTMCGQTRAKSEKEILSLHRKVEEEFGYEMKLFRPLYGDYDEALAKAASSLGYQCVLWSIDSLDWKEYGAEAVCQTILLSPNFGNGSVILCHCSAESIIAALDDLLVAFATNGYQSVPISTLQREE
jgi:peptidoglycan/xylan/chitin deacetylase (PgdA/CDA1 family)